MVSNRKTKRRASIGDYGMIGDCETAALISRFGSIDWLCLPRFDSPACFARLVGDEANGFWQVAPTSPAHTVRRRYVEDTLVLETVFETTDGVVKLTDFMPFRRGHADVVRIVECLAGDVEVHSEIVLRFGHGRLGPWVEPTRYGFIAIAGPHAVSVRSNVHMNAGGNRQSVRFKLAEGQSRWFLLSNFESHLESPAALDCSASREKTIREWRDWSARSRYEGPHRATVLRSLITLKALSHRHLGSIVAAPTTSLPEHQEGARNWDYRHCWLRDATFLLLSFLQAGHKEEAIAWRDWLVRAAAGDADKLQPVYGIAGEAELVEWQVPWLSGFNGVGPVRIGNDAHRQFQLDVLGEVLDVLHQAREQNICPSQASWVLQRRIAAEIMARWREPDAGVWEVRSEPRHFTHSKVMAWVGLDRAALAVDRYNLEGEGNRWREQADRIRKSVFARGFNNDLGAFTREFDSDELDASCLLFPQLGFVEPDDPRMRGTVRRIEQEMMPGGFVLRYDVGRSRDGLDTPEHAFLPCTCWLADVYALQGRREDANLLFERALSAANDLGLMSEEYDPRTGELMGNFPQALTHVSLVDTAFNLARMEGPAEVRRWRGQPGRAARTESSVRRAAGSQDQD